MNCQKKRLQRRERLAAAKFDVNFCTCTKVINTAAFNQVNMVSPPLD